MTAGQHLFALWLLLIGGVALGSMHEIDMLANRWFVMILSCLTGATVTYGIGQWMMRRAIRRMDG